MRDSVAHIDADLAVTLDENRPGMLAKALGCVYLATKNRLVISADRPQDVIKALEG